MSPMRESFPLFQLGNNSLAFPLTSVAERHVEMIKG